MPTMISSTENGFTGVQLQDQATEEPRKQKVLTTITQDSKRNVFCKRFFIGILLTVVGILSCIIYGSKHHAPEESVVCHTKECLRSAAALKHNMNLEVDPCEDFFTYTCGNWAYNHPRQENRQSNNWFAERQRKVYRNIRDRLEANSSLSDPKPVTQAKDMYKACVNPDVQSELKFAVIAKYIKEVGLPVIPTVLNHNKNSTREYKFDWIASIAKIRRTLGLSVIVGFDIVPDHFNKKRTRLTLGCPTDDKEITNLETFEWSQLRTSNTDVTETEREDADESEIGERMISVMGDLCADFYATKYIRYSQEVGSIYLEFEETLNGWSTEDISELPTYYSIEELQNITDSYITPKKPYPIWQHYLDKLFADLPDAKPTPEDKLQIKNEDVEYLKKLADFISEQPSQVIELYIWTSVVATLVGNPLNEMRSEHDCAMVVQGLMSLAVSYAFVDKDFLEHTKPRVEQMFEDVRLAFDEMVFENDWMDADTKRAAREKSEAKKILLGIPDRILDVTELENYYHGNIMNAMHHSTQNKLQTWRERNETYRVFHPTLVNAVYDLEWNALYLPVAVIQHPFYHHGLEAMNYGTLGYCLGHELTHGFDSTGRYYDKFGNKEDWWSSSILQEYDSRAKCLIEQYSDYYVKEAKGFIDGNLTLDENIADNGAIREALRAYRIYIKRRNGPEPSLPGFESFSPEQLFFIAYGTQHCAAYSPNADGEIILGNVHSPSEFRVKGVLSNMEEFAEAFQCAKGSAMNPEKKCRVW